MAESSTLVVVMKLTFYKVLFDQLADLQDLELVYQPIVEQQRCTCWFNKLLLNLASS